jgi:hypothetical protein
MNLAFPANEGILSIASHRLSMSLNRVRASVASSLRRVLVMRTIYCKIDSK